MLWTAIHDTTIENGTLRVIPEAFEMDADQNGVARGGFKVEKRPILTGANATGGEAEYGIRIAGTWETEVRRVLGDQAF